MTDATSALHHHHDGVFDQHLEGADQFGAERAVDGAVIAGQRDAHHVCHFDLAVSHDRTLFTGADREDGGVRRVDDRGEMIDPVHAEVGNGCRPALIFLGLEFPGPGAGGEILHLARDRRQRLGLGLADDRGDQPAWHRDRHADIGMLVLEHAAVGPAHIAVGNPLQRDGERLDGEIIDRELVERFLFLVLWRRGIDLLARREQLADIAVHRQIKMRHRLYRGGEPLRNGAAFGAAAAAGADFAGVSADGAAFGGAAATPAPAAFTSSPSPASTAITSLTATSWVPSGTKIFAMVPSSTASTSMVALSVSISAITSPDLTLSPSFLSHLARLPFSIVGDSAGIRMLIGIVSDLVATAARCCPCRSTARFRLRTCRRCASALLPRCRRSRARRHARRGARCRPERAPTYQAPRTRG